LITKKPKIDAPCVRFTLKVLFKMHTVVSNACKVSVIQNSRFPNSLRQQTVCALGARSATLIRALSRGGNSSYMPRNSRS